MTDDEKHEWGPWIEHDGKGCPCEGMYIHIMLGDLPDASCENSSWPSWIDDPIDDYEAMYWCTRHDGFIYGDGYFPIIRYRIRKPRGMKILESLLQNLPQDDKPKEYQLEVI